MFALLFEVNEYRNETIKSFGRRLYQENIECLHNEKFRSEQKITNKMNIPYEYGKSQDKKTMQEILTKEFISFKFPFVCR